MTAANRKNNMTLRWMFPPKQLRVILRRVVPPSPVAHRHTHTRWVKMRAAADEALGWLED